MALPKSYVAPNDLTDAEFGTLDDMLCQLEQPIAVADAVMLDGYLCGVLVQPKLIANDVWMATLLEVDPEFAGEMNAPDAHQPDSPPAPLDPAWVEKVSPLIQRRYNALNRAIVEDGLFDPFILEVDTSPEAETDDPETDDIFAELNPVSQALAPWVMGFQLACVHYESLLDTTDEAAMLALARLFRHLPRADKEMAELVETMERERPLNTLDEGIDELVSCTIELSDLMSRERFHVDTVRREAPKVGRNDPCPCGSGKKFKACHGAAV